MRLFGPKVLVLLLVAAPALAGCQSGRAAPAGDWVAGDGAYPVQLPHGRTAWLFGDSMIRKPDGNKQLVHNAIVVELRGGGPVTTIHGGTIDHPTDLIPATTPETVVWPGAGFVEGGTLQVFAEEISAAGGGFHSTGRRFQVGLELPGLRVTVRSEVYGGAVSWGQAVLAQGDDVYVYGNREIDGWTNITYLARFALHHSREPWQFWDGARFQPNPLLAAPLRGPDGALQVAKLSSVISRSGGIAAFTIDPYGATIDVREARDPWGPFSAKRPVYELPERNTYLPRAYWHQGRIQVAYSVLNARPRLALPLS